MNRRLAEIRAVSEILRYLKEEKYEDRDDFASRLAAAYLDSLLNQEDESTYLKRVSRIQTNFFKINRISKSDFHRSLYSRLKRRAIRPPKPAVLPPLSITDIFPDAAKVREKIGNIEKKLDIDERIIQNSMRVALREAGAYPIARRSGDSSLEVADIEHFHLKVQNSVFSFSVVVKGLNSLGKKRKVNWEDIAHQVTKAYNTHPDYVIVATAAEPVDRLVTEMHAYAKSVRKPNLIIFVPPMDLAKFLIWREQV